MKLQTIDTGELLSAILNEDLQLVIALTKHLISKEENLKHIILSEAKYSNTDFIEIPYILASKISTFEILEYLSSIVGLDEVNKIFYLPGGSINALLAAIEYDRLSNVDWLLCNGADASCENASEMGLHKAVKLSNYRLTKLLLQDHKVQFQINLQDSKGQTALHIATKNGHAAIIELLLLYSADPLAFNSDGLSPIHIAALEGHVHVVKLLCDKYQVDPKYQATTERNERSPLHFASHGGNHEIVSLLIKTYFVDPNSVDNNLNNALHCCFINPYNSNLLRSLEDYKMVAAELIPKISDITAKNTDNLKSEDLARLNGYNFCEEIFVQEIFKQPIDPMNANVEINGSVRRRIKKGSSQRTNSESQIDNSNRNSSHLIGVGSLYGFGISQGPIANLNNSDVTKSNVNEEINTFPRIKKANSVIENLPISIDMNNKNIENDNNDLDRLVKPTITETIYDRKNKDLIKSNSSDKNEVKIDNNDRNGNFKTWFEEQTKMLKEQDQAESSFPIAQSTPPPSTKFKDFSFPNKLKKDKKPASFQDPIIETKKASKNKPPPPPKNFKLSKRKDSANSDEKILVRLIDDNISENRNSTNEDEFKPIPKPRIKILPTNSTSSEMHIEIPMIEQKPMTTFSTKDADTNLNIYKTEVKLVDDSEQVTRRPMKNFPRTLSKTASIEVQIPNPYELSTKASNEKEENPEVPIFESIINNDPKIKQSILKESYEYTVSEKNAFSGNELETPVYTESEQPRKKSKKSTKFKNNSNTCDDVAQEELIIPHATKQVKNKENFKPNDQILIPTVVAIPKATKRIKNVEQPMEDKEKLNFTPTIHEINKFQEKHISAKNVSSSLEDSDSLSDEYDSDEITDRNTTNQKLLLNDVRIIEVNRNAEKKFGFSIVGGNSEGIFIHTLVNVSTNLLEIGDQVMGVDGLSIGGRTREEMYKLFDMCKNTVTLSVVKNKEQYEKILDTGNGDKFYVRAKFLHDASKKRELKIKDGDIFCVTDSIPDKYEGFWWAQKMQVIKGEEQIGLIPNQSQADQILIKQQLYSNRNGAFFRSFRRAKSVERLTQKKLNDSIDSVNTSMMICSYERVVQKQAEGNRLVIVLGLFGVMVIDLLVRDSPELYTSLPPNLLLETGDDNEPINLKLLRSFIDKTGKSLLVMLQPNTIEFLKNKTNLNPIVIYLSPISKVIVKAVKMKLMPNFDKNPSHMYNEAAKFEKNYQNLFTNTIAYTSDDWWFFHLKETINQAQHEPIWITEEEALLENPIKNIKSAAKPKAKARTTDDLHNTSTASLSRIQTSTFDTQNRLNTKQHVPIKDRPGLPIPQKKQAVIPTTVATPEVDETILRPSRPSSKFDQTKFIVQRSSSEEDSDDISSDDDDEDLPINNKDEIVKKLPPTKNINTEDLKNEILKATTKFSAVETDTNKKNVNMKEPKPTLNNLHKNDSRNNENNDVYSRVTKKRNVQSIDAETNSISVKSNKAGFEADKSVNSSSNVQKINNINVKGYDKNLITETPKMNIHAKFGSDITALRANEFAKINPKKTVIVNQPVAQPNSESESETYSEDDSSSEESSEEEKPAAKPAPVKNIVPKATARVQFSNQHSRETPI